VQVLLLGANPGTDNSEVFADVVAPLLTARPKLDVAWRVSGGASAT